MTIASVHVYEICMALPDVVCVILRDQEIVKGSLLELASPDPDAYNSVQQRDPVTGAVSTTSGKYARVVGQKNGVEKMYLRFGDTMPTQFLNRATIDVAANWAAIGTRTVTAVYRKTYPLDQGVDLFAGGGINRISTLEHQVFLQLSGNLAQGGPYTISCGSAFPATPFLFNDKETRAIGLHASMLGFRPSDASKLADFSLWIPRRGTEGRVNLPVDYSITAFELINTSGTVVHTGTMTEYITPIAAETGITNLTYASSTVAPKVATGISRANPCVVTVPSHGFANGQQKILRNFGVTGNGYFDESLEGIAQTIAGVTTNTFTIPVDTSGRPTAWAAGTFDAGHDSLVFDVFTANRYATTVSRCDFSAFTTAGHYRVRIPGVGVSDPFLIDNAVRFHDAKVHMQGYYNQLSGAALDPAVGNWSRPVDFRHGVNGMQILLSKCPSYFSYETAGRGPVGTPGIAPWITATTVPGWTVSVRDAGDWDYHAERHCVMAYQLLEYGYLQLPSAKRNISLGFPKASALLGSTYSGIDTLGDQVHMALAQLDTWRVNQQGDGRIYGGLQFYNEQPGNPAYGGGSDEEPSHCSTQTVYLLEADPVANLYYAQAAAKMAQVFAAVGQSSLATTWQSSAVAAWNWAETLYQEWLTHSGSANLNAATNIQAHFNTRCSYQTNLGLTDAQFKTAMSGLFGFAAGIRTMTAGMLYRLTGTKSPYGNVVGGQFALSQQNETYAMATWEFYQHPNVNTDYSGQGTYYATYWTDADIVRARQGQWAEIVRAFLCTASTRQPSNTHLKILQDLVSYDSGRNPACISTSPGIGARYPRNVLLRDREAMALPSSSTPGVPVYNNLTKQPHGGTFYANWGVDGALNWTAESPTSDYDSSGGKGKLLTPLRHQVPVNESFRDNSYMIYMTEFTTQETVVPRLIQALILHAYDSNDAAAVSVPKLRVKMRAA